MTRNLCWYGLRELSLFLLVSSLVLLMACGSEQATQSAYPKVITDFELLPDDFKEFHQRFHTDSIYQMNRIEFPLRGLPAHFTVDDVNYQYEESSWVLHKAYDINSKLYEREWIVFSENEIEETIRSTEADFGMSRTFKQNKDYWYLIYYAAMNRLNTTGEPVGTEKPDLEENTVRDTIPMEKI